MKTKILKILKKYEELKLIRDGSQELTIYIPEKNFQKVVEEINEMIEVEKDMKEKFVTNENKKEISNYSSCIEAVKFYKEHKNDIGRMITTDSNPNFDWDNCRKFCRQHNMPGIKSDYKFKQYVINFFGIAAEDFQFYLEKYDKTLKEGLYKNTKEI